MAAVFTTDQWKALQSALDCVKDYDDRIARLHQQVAMHLRSRQAHEETALTLYWQLRAHVDEALRLSPARPPAALPAADAPRAVRVREEEAATPVAEESAGPGRVTG